MNKVLIFDNTSQGNDDFINCIKCLCRKETIVTTSDEIKNDLKILHPFEFWEKYLNPDYVERIIINSPNFKQII